MKLLDAAKITATTNGIGETPRLDPTATAVDVITNPRLTPFLETARARGCAIVDGVEMLVQLAMQLFERWTGVRPEESVFQRAVAAALGEEPSDVTSPVS